MTPEEREAIRSHARELRDQAARLHRRWGNWWRIVQAWRENPAAEHLVALCSYCGRCRDGDGEWLEVPPELTKFFRLDSGPPVTHGICTDCLPKAGGSPSA